MEQLADEYTTTVAALKALAKELRIRNPAKLLQAARGRVPGANLRLAQLALADSASKQVLAPAYRSTGKSAAQEIDTTFQADLIDFSQNVRSTKEKYALLLADVYSREIRSVPLLNKKPETINAAMRSVMPEFAAGKSDYTISTDKGKEFSRLEDALPQAVHREKQSTNDIAVVDRAMQSLKTDLAAIVADGDARNWKDALPRGVDAHNARPHSAVFGPPQTVQERPVQDFRVLQDNARKGLLNRNSQLSKSKALKEAGAFRAPLPSKRSFEPRYGDVQLLGGVRRGDANDVVRNRGEGTFLLKEVQAVEPGTANSAGRLTEKNLPRAIRLRERGRDVEEHVRMGGGQVQLSLLEREVRRGGLDGLRAVLRRNNITLKGFLRLFRDMFQVRNGIVSIKEAVDTPAPEVPLEEQIRQADERAATKKAARKEIASLRLRGLSTSYGSRAPL